MSYFHYGQQEIDYLTERDPKLGRMIAHFGKINREVRSNLFEQLISSIISQQISDKAAATIGERLYALCDGEMTAAALDRLSEEQIQGCGMSFRKASYLKGIAHAAHQGEIDFEKLPQMSDDEVIRALSSLRGVGRWTAEMLLIFALERPDVLSFDDLGIRRGIERLHGIERIGKKEFERFRKLYSPCGTVASFYLWKIAGTGLDQMSAEVKQSEVKQSDI